MPIDKWDDRILVMLVIGEGRGRRFRMKGGIDVFLYGWIWQWLHSRYDDGEVSDWIDEMKVDESLYDGKLDGPSVH